MDRNRLLFHLMPPQGWMNDPNGLCQFQGVYHVFFQYTPESPRGGNKSWGHYTSPDWIHWTYEGEPLRPDKDFDRDGVFSGSAFLYDEKMYLYYTGNVEQEGVHDYVHTGREANTILVTSEDGKSFGEKQCIMSNGDYPSEYTCHIRDPKVWQQDGQFFMIQGGRLIGDKGAVLIFQSEDLVHWKFYKDITTEYDFGFMWECPDYFVLSKKESVCLDEKESLCPDKDEEGAGLVVEEADLIKQDKNFCQRILSLSPQGLQAEKYRYQNIYQSGYFPVEGDILDRPSLGEFIEWDMGFDFYAPQTFVDEQGRRILIGWAGLADEEYDNEPTIQRGWQHALTVPRVLSWKNGQVYQNPVEELMKLRLEEKQLKTKECVVLQDDWGQGNAKVYEIRIENIASQEFSVNLSQNGSGLCLKYEAGVFSLGFFGEDALEIGRGRTIRKVLLEQLTDCRILLDTSLIEIYLNQGEVVLTSRYYLLEKHCEAGRPFMLQLDGGDFQGSIWELRGFVTFLNGGSTF